MVSIRHLLFATPLSLFLAGCLTAQTPHTSTASPRAPKKPEVVSTSATATPAASCSPAISYSAVHVDGPFIAMTFDDGPSEKLTPQLLDLLAARHIRATFFLVGKNVAEYPAIVQRAAREGH